MRDLINKLQYKIFYLLNFVYLAVGLLCGLIVYYFFNEDFLALFYVVVLFFWLTGGIISFLIDRTVRKKANKLLSVYMALRMAKFLLTIIFLAVFILFILADNYKLPFAITLMGNYLLYTTLELYTFNLYHKYSIKNAEKE